MAFADGAERRIARIAVGGSAGARAEAIRRLAAAVGARAVGEGPLRDGILGSCALP